MKKLFTLVALLTVFMGVNAANWQKVYEKSYSEFTAFPYYVMGYVPEWYGGIMTDFGANYRYAKQEDLDGDGDAKWKDGESSAGTAMAGSTEYQKVTGAGPYWHQYFIADGIPTQMDGHYKAVAKVKATAACTINVNMGNWGSALGCNVSIPQSDEFVEVEWEYDNMPVTSCFLVAQPGTCTETIEWESITVYEDQGGTRPVVWQQWLTNDGKSIIDGEEHTNKYVGDAEFGAWPDWALETTDGVNINWRTDRAPEICAWALTMGKNNDSGEFQGEALDGRARPYPADIEAEEGNESNHVFAVHVNQIDCIDDCDGEKGSTAWSNQFWIQSPVNAKEGLSVRIKFRYKAEHACSTGTQLHRMNPSSYRDWNACGDVNFTENWQDFEQTKSIGVDDVWSLAFNLCSDATNGRTPNVFYFDDLSWETMKLDEGYFIAGINTNIATKYEDLNEAVQFEDGVDADEGNPCLVATVGTKGNEDSWVNQVMISTVRGDNGAFMGATLKPAGKIKNDPTVWLEYSASNLAKLDLPGLGVWTVYLDEEYNSMAFQMIEGIAEEEKEPVDVITISTEMVVNATERDWRGKDNDGNLIEEQEGAGQPWDNQFWIAANRDLKKDEVTVLKFKYKAKNAARTSTQAHKVGGDGIPCTYLNWQAIGDVNFTEEWQDFSTDFTVPAGDDGMRSFTFNLSEVKAANDYYFKDVQWYLKDESLDEGKTYENLLNADASGNFWVKIGAGSDPYQYGTDPSGIANVAAKGAKTSAVMYNLAGQRVANSFKGIVVKDGKKFVK